MALIVYEIGTGDTAYYYDGQKLIEVDVLSISDDTQNAIVTWRDKHGIPQSKEVDKQSLIYRNDAIENHYYDLLGYRKLEEKENKE